MFANSPFVEGKPYGGKSERAKVWLDVDPDRSRASCPSVWKKSANSRLRRVGARRADVHVQARRQEGGQHRPDLPQLHGESGFQGHKPDMTDWETHLNTLFPEVRLKNTIEVRGADSQGASALAALPALWTGIFYDRRRSIRQATSRHFTYDEMVTLRPQVARLGVRAMFRGKPIADHASRLIEIAQGGLVRRARRVGEVDESVHLTALANLVAQGKSPADELIEGLSGDSRHLEAELMRRARSLSSGEFRFSNASPRPAARLNAARWVGQVVPTAWPRATVMSGKKRAPLHISPKIGRKREILELALVLHKVPSPSCCGSVHLA